MSSVEKRNVYIILAIKNFGKWPFGVGDKSTEG
jgi:hypothetical protein